ncbi:MAG: class I SAM-dependent methyltransferase [Syntrophobacteraceae bacterium]
MSYIFRLHDTERYESWFRSDLGQSVFALQKDLLLKVWAPVARQRVLEVGCGSGIFLEWLNSLGHSVTGLDPSGPSIELARRRLGGRVGLERGFAEDLPFSDNEFDTVALITSLEFVGDPAKALREAFRVARSNVLLGVLNKYSIGRVHYFLEKFWKDSLYAPARFFSVFELKNMTDRILCGQVPKVWRTCFAFPLPFLRYLHLLERCPFFHRLPFGHFIAMRIDLRNRFLTLQTPVFSELPSGVGNASVRSLCWRSSQETGDER